MNKILSNHTGKTVEEIGRDTERDNFMSSPEAVEYGIIDRVFTTRAELLKESE